MKWILRNLKGTFDLGLVFDISKVTFESVVYVDSDNDGDLNHRKSHSGYIITLCGGYIS